MSRVHGWMLWLPEVVQGKVKEGDAWRAKRPDSRMAGGFRKVFCSSGRCLVSRQTVW